MEAGSLMSPQKSFSESRCIAARCLPFLIAILAAVSAHSQETQGVYLDRLTVDETENALAYVSTQNPTEDLFVTNYVTGVEFYRENVTASEQTNGPTPWIAAEWSRSETLPLLPSGFYMVQVDPSAAVPNNVPLSEDTYRVPLFVVPTEPVADVLFISPSLTSTCYNAWGGRSCYTSPSNPDVGFKKPGYFPNFYNRMRYVVERLEALGHTWDIMDEQYLEDHPEFIGNYRAAIVVEQIEYSTYAMRRAYDDYIDSGGRLLILGNEVWIIMMRRNGDTYSTYKRSDLTDPFAVDGDPTNDHLIADHSVIDDPGPDYPETRSTGVSTWLGYNPTEDHWTAWRTGHWFYAGSGLSDGDGFRDGSTGGLPVLPSQIIDGVTTRFTGGLPFVTNHTRYDIPTGTLILATIPTSNARPWDCVNPSFWNSPECYQPGTAAITIRETEEGGVVMVIPDKRWISLSQVSGEDPVAVLLLDNALSAFASPSAMDVYAGYSSEAPIPALSEIASVVLFASIIVMCAGVLYRRRPEGLSRVPGR
jgi:hypothetical protein